MSRNLTRKQVRALSRALKRRGRKLPKIGYCTLFGPKAPGGGTIVARATGTPGEVCHDARGYYFVGGMQSHHKSARRREKFGREWPPPKGRR